MNRLALSLVGINNSSCLLVTSESALSTKKPQTKTHAHQTFPTLSGGRSSQAQLFRIENAGNQNKNNRSTLSQLPTSQ
jgi:hypothetical protein